MKTIGIAARITEVLPRIDSRMEGLLSTHAMQLPINSERIARPVITNFARLARRASAMRIASLAT